MIELYANDIQVNVGAKTLLHDVSIHLRSGDVLLLCGHNGSGKTTFLKVLAYQGTPSSGTYEIMNDGAQLSIENAKQIIGSQIGEIVFFKNSTPVTTLRSQTYRFGISCDTDAILTAFNLYHLKHQHCMELSKGERKRLGLARAFCTEPHIVLLDEPESGLDEKSFSTLLEKIKNIRDEGGISVIATHMPERFVEFNPLRLEFSKGEVVEK